MELQRYVGEKIKEFRLKRGLSQEELAELLETTKQTVSRYENGDRKANQDILFQLSTIFNISIDDFFPSRNTLLTVAERKAEFKVDNMKSYDYFPISVSAGLPINVEPTVEAKKITIPDELLGKHAGGKNIYFMKVNGDSMNKIIPHDSLIAVKLRHTHATMLVESGVDIKTIQKRLGHSRAAITEDRYVHLTQKMARNAADVFDSIANNL